MSMTEADLRARWPQAFNNKRLPLVVGVHEAMRIARGNPVMAAWCAHRKYLRNCADGFFRIDLTGKPVAEIEPAERKYARAKLAELRRTRAVVIAGDADKEKAATDQGWPLKS